MNILDPVFLGDRVGMKKKYGLDFFIANIVEAGSGLPFPKFFQKNRDGDPKGIIVVKLRAVTAGVDDFQQWFGSSLTHALDKLTEITTIIYH